MAGVVCSVTLVLTVTRTVFVLDAVSSRAFTRAAQAITSKATQIVSQRGPQDSPQQQGTAGVGCLRFSALHKRLLAMHFISAIYMSAAVAKYGLPASETFCRISQGIMVGTILLYDASLVLFLLAKTRVTNGNRSLAKWETAITWWSRFYACIYLPACAIILPFALSSAVNEEGMFCVTEPQADGKITKPADTLGFATNNAMLIIQFVLLLAMFVKPMLAPQSSTQSGGAVYRRVVVRSAVCTIGIVLAYSVTTLVIVRAMLGRNDRGNKEDQIIDAAAPVNMLTTLCLTEIALPLGFISCVKSIRAGRNVSTSQLPQQRRGAPVLTTKPSSKLSTKPSTNPLVVPMDGNVSDPA